jgi:phosphinothricin acetyltransferase
MEIRHADAERDAAACAGIYDPYIRDTVISLEEVPVGAAGMAERIRRITRTHPWVVAEEDGRVIGYAYGSAHHERAAYRWATNVTVYVSADQHRKGVGRAVYETLFDLLAEQNFQVACAGITLPNDASVGLHESLGFKPVGIYRSIGYKFGSWWDVGWWQRPLLVPQAPVPAELTAPDRRSALRRV